ncbi:hypothetical protein QBC42DRAFT_311123 [Cladorrhinum samala]|uniref:Uncharacterized protein n=1 Tax=Cladorrhinum samala TaxID=585594 RepID=A0AAV9HKX3_9PEZI|nr:hypothetical protein QBC42DRAFT_311123 [Cladorrhinum samala]
MGSVLLNRLSAFTVTCITIAVNSAAVRICRALQEFCHHHQQAGSNHTNAAMRSWAGASGYHLVKGGCLERPRESHDTAAVLDVLAPLLDERHILPKAANTGSAAAVGAVVAMAAAFFWWNPGLPHRKFVAAHGTASAATISAGGVTAAVRCGLKAKIGHDKCRLMDKGYVNTLGVSAGGHGLAKNATAELHAGY